LIEAAARAYANNEWDKAEQLCRTILQTRPDTFEALNLLGIVKAQTRHPEEAADLLKRAVAVRPGDAAAHSNYGNVLCDLGRPRDALPLYERALQLDPRYPETYNNRGRALRALGELSAALESYDRLIGLQPDNGQAHYNRGVIDGHTAPRRDQTASRAKPPHIAAVRYRTHHEASGGGLPADPRPLPCGTASR
jgi:tetratricopeptide (TPR) repeat protein